MSRAPSWKSTKKKGNSRRVKPRMPVASSQPDRRSVREALRWSEHPSVIGANAALKTLDAWLGPALPRERRWIEKGSEMDLTEDIKIAELDAQVIDEFERILEYLELKGKFPESIKSFGLRSGATPDLARKKVEHRRDIFKKGMTALLNQRPASK